MSSSAIDVPATLVNVTYGSMKRIINRSCLLSYKKALATVRDVFEIGLDVPDKDILLGVKCTVDQGSEFLFVRGSSEWSAIAREMKHIKIVRAPGKAEVGGVKHEVPIKDENDAAAQCTVIEISDDSDSDTEAGDAAELPDDNDVAMPMDVDNDDGDGAGTVNIVSKAEHNKIASDYLDAHRAAPWVVPPAALAQVLYAHIKKLASLKENDKPRVPLPAAVLHELESSIGRKWLIKQLVHTKVLNRKRRVLVDGPIFYNTLVAAHRGSSGNAHNAAGTMRKEVGKKFVLGPKSDFYALWVSRCPGCNQ